MIDKSIHYIETNHNLFVNCPMVYAFRWILNSDITLLIIYSLLPQDLASAV